MALTLTAPASSPNDVIVVVLASDEGNFFGIGRSDFSLRRADTNAAIGATIAIDAQGGSGSNYSWNITVTQTDGYTGLVYLQLAANSIRSLVTLQFGPSRALNSNQFRFRDIPPPAAPVISTFDSPLDFLINVPINFAIPISGSPNPVKIEGVLDELSYHWDADAGTLYLRGTPTSTRTNKGLTIYATEAVPPNRVISKMFSYNVRNPAPIITEIRAVRIVRGVAQNIFIPVTNSVVRAVVEGLIIGLSFTISSTEDQKGILIQGTVPIDDVFTTETGRFWVSAENDGGADTWGSRDSGGLAWTLARASLPAQVSGVQAAVSGTTVTLSWTAPNDGGTPITGYEYQIDSGEWTPTLSTSTRVVIEDLQRRVTPYQLRVRALNGLGAGPASSSTSASVRPIVTLPTISNIASVALTRLGSVTLQSGNAFFTGIYFTSRINDGGAGSLTSIEYSLDRAAPRVWLSDVPSSHAAYGFGQSSRFMFFASRAVFGSIVTNAGQHTVRVRISNSSGTSQWSNLLTIQVPSI